MHIGFIGTGSMGSLLIEAFIKSHAVTPEQVIANNRTQSKAQKLADAYPGMQIAQSAKDTVLGSDVTFICVKPLEFKKVIDDIRGVITPTHIIVSITSPVLIKHLEQELPCKIAKVVPSITNSVMSGATLCTYGKKMKQNDRDWLEGKLSYFSTPLEVEEQYTRVTSDISSCSPAFLAYFIEQLINAAVDVTGIPSKEATRLAGEMALGTGQLLTSGGFTPKTLQERVSVPGGVTAEGLKLLKEELSGVFHQLIKTTHKKYEEDVKKVEQSFRTDNEK